MKHRFQWIALTAWILLVNTSCSTNDGGDTSTAAVDTSTEQDTTSDDTQIEDDTQAEDDTQIEEDTQTEGEEPFALEPGINELTWEEELSIGTTEHSLHLNNQELGHAHSNHQQQNH